VPDTPGSNPSTAVAARGGVPTRDDPFAEFNRFTRRLTELVDDRWPDAAPLMGRAGFSPPADVEETDDAYLIELDLPGVTRKTSPSGPAADRGHVVHPGRARPPYVIGGCRLGNREGPTMLRYKDFTDAVRERLGGAGMTEARQAVARTVDGPAEWDGTGSQACRRRRTR
jgi:hypothetical protein